MKPLTEMVRLLAVGMFKYALYSWPTLSLEVNDSFQVFTHFKPDLLIFRLTPFPTTLHTNHVRG